MKLRSKLSTLPFCRGVLILVVLLTVCLTLSPHPVKVQGQENILSNPGFEGGWYDVNIGQVPNNWRWHWLDNVPFPGGDSLALAPESRVLPKGQVPENERDKFFRDGTYTVKVFKEHSPIYAALSQDVKGLEVGRKYKFSVPVCPDTFDWENKKVAPEDPYAVRIRLGAGPKGVTWLDEGAIKYSGWWDASTVSNFNFNYHTYSFEFVATQEEMTVYAELSVKWGYDNSGFFLDGLGLYPMEQVNTPEPTSPPPPPTPTAGPSPTPPATATPRPDGATVHIVESGDTLYGIALTYNVSADQIRELNAGTIGPNDLLQVGQELVISLPSQAATATPLPQPPTATPQAQPTGEGEGEGGGEGEDAGEGETTPPTVAPSPTPSQGASICVLAYHDRNGDTFHNPETEELLPNAEFTVADASGVVGEYTTDGISEPYCFTNLTPGAYRVIQKAPPGYAPSGMAEQNVALAEGTSFNFQFGDVPSEGEGAGEGEGNANEPTEPNEGDPAPNEGGNGNNETSFQRILAIVARIAGVMVLVLAAGTAVLFVLTRRNRY